MKTIISVLLLSLFAISVHAQTVPQTVAFQGYLTDTAGNALTQPAKLRFAIYIDGARYWYAEYANVGFSGGRFSVMLGSSAQGGVALNPSSGSPISATNLPVKPVLFSLMNSSSLVEVQTEVWNGSSFESLSPRTPLASSVFALRAEEAKTFDGYSSSAFLRWDTSGAIVSKSGVAVVDTDGNWIGSPSGLQGPAGPAGPAGVAGADGPQGIQGLKGDKGDKGDTGDVGPQGIAGAIGLQGPQGPVGLPGLMGPAGLDGVNGAQGPAGAMGPAGPQGVKGDTGDVGPQGPQGVAGAIGLQGPIGLTGAVGPAGAMGPAGPQGPIGLTGPAGVNGIDGSVGAQGPIGLTGATGPAGPQGVAGVNGIDGAPGAQGPAGPQGPAGATGAAGPQGPAGTSAPWSTSGTSMYYNLGNVGIGTMLPGYLLTVTGLIKSTTGGIEYPDNTRNTTAGGDLQLLIVQDEKAQWSDGGTFTSGAWCKRTLNTQKYNTISGASINTATSQITLPAGTYWIESIAPATNIGDHQARFQNVSDGMTSVLGQSNRSNADSVTNALVTGVFTIASAKTFELQHIGTNTNNGDGLGEGGGFGTEVFSIVKIHKIK